MDPGFEIAGRFYPFPTSFRLGDPVLVTEVTGLDWPNFTERLDDADYDDDLVTLAGLVAVALWQKNPTWRRDRVVREIERLDLENLRVVGDEPADDVPPAIAETVSEPVSATPANGSSSTPEPASDETTPNGSGQPDLLGGPRGLSPQAA